MSWFSSAVSAWNSPFSARPFLTSQLYVHPTRRLKTLRPTRHLPLNLGSLITLLASLWASSEAVGAQPRPAANRWYCSTTENFLTYTTDATLGPRLANHCESQRKCLAEQWLGEDATCSWNTRRCIIVVHPTAKEYVAAVGRGGEQSSGCSTTQVSKGTIVFRRIDLRADRGDPLTAALPHELTHVVLADRFIDRPLPRWADEGMAILADPLPKQQSYQRDAQLASVSAARFTARDLLLMVDYPLEKQKAAFYGQSAALVKYLVSRGGAKKFLNFVERSMSDGSDEALRAVYEITDVAELERLWLRDGTEILVARE